MSERKLPVRVHRGGLSGRYYAITNYKVIDASRDLIEARTKHDVTADVEGLIAEFAEDAFYALLEILPLVGSRESGYRIAERIDPVVAATAEEWASAAHALLELCPHLSAERA